MRWIRRVIWLSLGLALLVLTLLAFSLTPSDRARARDFCNAVDRWQSNADFRKIQREYVSLGSRAMQARLWGRRAENVVMAFRNLPGLPTYLAVSRNSAAHYRDFSQGELPAYLHLAGEQGTRDGIVMLEKLMEHGPPSDDAIRQLLRSFDLPYPVATDDAAVASMRSLLADTNPQRPFTIRTQIPPLLPHVYDLDQLDAQVRSANPELWRTKQVSDFLAGIWAQNYGRIYQTGILWLLRIQRMSQLLLVALVIGIALYIKRRRRQFAPPSPSATIDSCPEPNPPPVR
jgi:hypothetical protein